MSVQVNSTAVNVETEFPSLGTQTVLCGWITSPSSLRVSLGLSQVSLALLTSFLPAFPGQVKPPLIRSPLHASGSQQDIAAVSLLVPLPSLVSSAMGHPPPGFLFWLPRWLCWPRHTPHWHVCSPGSTGPLVWHWPSLTLPCSLGHSSPWSHFLAASTPAAIPTCAFKYLWYHLEDLTSFKSPVMQD